MAISSKYFHKSFFQDSYLIWKIILITSAGICLLPILLLFSELKLFDVPLFSFLMKNVIPRYVGNTIFALITITSFTMILGSSLAWVAAVYTFPFRRILIFLQTFPLLVPAYISAIVWRNAFSYGGFMEKLFGNEVSAVSSSTILIFVLTWNLYPYVFLILYIFFTTISQSHFDIARNMNSTGKPLFIRLGLSIGHIPLLGAMMLIIMEIMNESWIYNYLGYDFFTTGIVRIWESYGNMSIARIFTLVVVILMAFLVIGKTMLERREHKFHPIRGNKLSPLPITGVKSVGAIILATMPLLLGFLVPFIQLIVWAIPSFIHSEIPSDLLQVIFNSFLVAIIVICIQIPLAIFLSYSFRLCKSVIYKISFSFLTLGYAIPSILVAMLVLSTIKLLDDIFPHYSFYTTFVSSGLVALIAGQVYRYLPIALNSINTGIHQTNTHYEEVSRSLGCSPLKTLFKICIPINRRYIITASMITIIEVLRDVPMTRLLHPFNFSTLALKMFYLINNESLSQASVVGLTLVVIGIVIILPIYIIIIKRGEEIE